MDSACESEHAGTDDEVKMGSIVDCNMYGECANCKVCVNETCQTCQDVSVDDDEPNEDCAT